MVTKIKIPHDHPPPSRIVSNAADQGAALEHPRYGPPVWLPLLLCRIRHKIEKPKGRENNRVYREATGPGDRRLEIRRYL